MPKVLPEAPALPVGPFSIVYADPPWSFKCWAKDRGHRTAESFYKTLTLDAIASLPVKSICTPDAALFLWVPSSLLPDALYVMERWGFYYTTIAFVWVKRNKKSDTPFWGMGHWTRTGAEVCLFGVHGNPKRVSAGVHQVLIAPPREHSRKPDGIRERIVQLLGDVPRIELFAREQADGWSAWGDETERFMT